MSKQKGKFCREFKREAEAHLEEVKAEKQRLAEYMKEYENMGCPISETDARRRLREFEEWWWSSGRERPSTYAPGSLFLD